MATEPLEEQCPELSLTVRVYVVDSDGLARGAGEVAELKEEAGLHR
jgi:hypothetical protein